MKNSLFDKTNMLTEKERESLLKAIRKEFPTKKFDITISWGIMFPVDDSGSAKKVLIAHLVSYGDDERYIFPIEKVENSDAK